MQVHANGNHLHRFACYSEPNAKFMQINANVCKRLSFALLFA
jgi:hypothetical protein